MAAPRVSFKSAGLTATQTNFGWVKVKYWDRTRMREVETNVRPRFWREVVETPLGRFDTVEGVFYSKWISETKAGSVYTAVKQVEGIYKVARAKGNQALMDEVAEVLKRSPEAIAAWYKRWLDMHTNVELEEFYDYEAEPAVDDGSGLTPDMYD